MPRFCCLVLLILLALLGGSTRVFAALTDDDLKPLAEDDFEAKSQALDRIIAADDAVALRLLEAMQQESVAATSDDRVLIEDGDVLKDPITGAPVAVQASDVQPITLNNLLRARVASGLNGLRLEAPDHAVREKAINDLFQNPDPAAKPLIEAARSKETDPMLKARLDQLWALTALQDPDSSKRLQAVQLIDARKNPQMRSLLLPLVTRQKDGTYAETEEKVRAAASEALRSMAFEEWKIEMIGTLFAGLSLGSILLLAALGLAITYGLIGVINMAHGEFLMIGAYATYVVQECFRAHWQGAFDWYVLAAVPASFLAAALAGFILERSVLRFLYGRPLETLLSTFGISLVLIQAVRMLFGAQNVEVSNPSWMSGGVALMPELILPFNRITIMVFALTVVGIASLVLNKTRLGLYIRATTQNRRMAACSGIRTWQVDSYAFA
ncbi:MAG: urea ABC transporter permease subunit UrtB, partial [Verrucomicrobia bacterium]|nr:urea ABC transporter permease subunit UrtB [Verrucomicrobiota bacterium]